jgi:hypothetical protein
MAVHLPLGSWTVAKLVRRVVGADLQPGLI